MRSLTLTQAAFITSDSLAVKAGLITTENASAMADWTPARAVTAVSGDTVSVGKHAIIRSEGVCH